VFLVQEVQPDVPVWGFSVPDALKTENFFFISSEFCGYGKDRHVNKRWHRL